MRAVECSRASHAACSLDFDHSNVPGVVRLEFIDDGNNSATLERVPTKKLDELDELAAVLQRVRTVAG